MTSAPVSPASSAVVSPATDSRDFGAGLVLALALIAHLWIATLGWNSTGLPHNGFREAQTAISAHFIQKEGDFSLAYPTPVLGPPWSAPMEFPLYQWTVVMVSEVTGIDLPMAGRVVGLLCFYLTLPAFFAVLATLGFARWQRFLLLAAIISCPLYLFYARAFLIETMALMFSAWFLLGYIRTGETQRSGWFALALGAGLLAALVKVTTFLFFLLPAAAWSVYWLWADVGDARNRRWDVLLRRAVWCGLAALVPVLVALVWVSYADGVKGGSVAAAFLQSENLRGFNYGFGRRFTADTWSQHVDIWFGDLAWWPVFAAWGLLALMFARQWWRQMLLLLGFFMIVQVIFPLLYAFHAYYYVANAWTLMMVFGLAAVAILQSRLPRSISWSVIVALTSAQIGYCVNHHWSRLHELEPGNRQLMLALQEATKPEDVLVVAGDDWSSIIPYHSQRRALMLRTGMESDRAFLDEAFATLRDYKVGALIVQDEQRFNAALIGLARDVLKIDGRQAFSWGNVDVYLAQGERDRVVADLLRTLKWPEIQVNAWQAELTGKDVEFSAVPERYKWLFAGVDPLPRKYFTGVALARYEQDQRSYFDAQPPKRLWFRLAAGKHTFSAEIGILPGAYADEIAHRDRTDGIEVVLTEERPGIEPRVIFTQQINPRDRYDQRGLMKLKHEFTLEAEGDVVFSVNAGPHNNAARDWTIMGPLMFR